MPTNTYVALARTDAAGATSVTFDLTSISGYKDLVIIAQAKSSTSGSSVNSYRLRFNGLSTSLYSNTFISANGSTAVSTRDTSGAEMYVGALNQTSLNPELSTIHIMNYANTTTFKTVLARGNSASSVVNGTAGVWRSTVAITSIELFMSAATLTGTFALYGIKAVGGDTAVKALGGTITEDATYFYHTFKGSSTFTPLQTLTCDYLLVAGGGGGYNGDTGGRAGGGGGAGGLRSTVGSTGGSGSLESAITMTAVAHNIIVGAGGALAAGNNSSITGGAISIVSTGGGVGGNASGNGGAGGSGGGSSAGGSAASGGAASPSGQGFAGGSTSLSPQNNYISAAGGGAGGVGENGVTGGATSVGGAGRTITAWSNATSTGFGGVGKYAGGGGGGVGQFAGGTLGTNLCFGGGNGGYTNPSAIAATAGSVNTGSGGGGGNSSTDGRPATGGVGGSGIVIIRYTKA